ncbi:MAG: glycogen/starch/alpha-glucan phosphorylase [Armatimonadota bacterium]
MLPPADWCDQRGKTREELVDSFKRSIFCQLRTRLVKDFYNATRYDRFLCAAYTAADQLADRWIATQQRYHRENGKRVYYLSMEYLLGRSLACNLINQDLYDICEEALASGGQQLSDLLESEADAGLGNGGLGRLAACFLDSMATMNISAHGYGLRYDYGLFKQHIVNGQQAEVPDHWLALPNPWEVARPESVFTVHFGGRVRRLHGGDPTTLSEWVDCIDVLATPYDMPIPGYGNDTVNTLRLWNAQAREEFNLSYFNQGEYLSACAEQILSENITKVLYPNDHIEPGRELRLKQEYFLISASIQDIIQRFKRVNFDWTTFPDKAAIQLNDTHPSLAIPELMRLLIDHEEIDWKQAWSICVKTFAYTNHTIMPEALEEWPVRIMESLLPRHMEIIYLINHHFMKEVARRYPGDVDRMRRMSIISEDGEKRVRMAHLCLVGSHTVNGVAELHTRILEHSILRDFCRMWPHKFTNKTNGITPRRWLRQANPGLSTLITEAIGPEWVTDLTHLHKLESLADDAGFQDAWRTAKLACKEPMIRLLESEHVLSLDPASIFDVQAKRIHEYKRQLLFALYIISQYLRIKENPHGDFVPRTCVISGKAAPSYDMAKRIIHFINRIAETVNSDPAVCDLLRVIFLPNYQVSMAEKLIPSANLSEQLSTAGHEASGTGNMKFALNGALTIGTLDGANVEILEEVGDENIFIFGLNADEVASLRHNGYSPRDYIKRSPELQQVLHLLECDFFSPGEPGLFRPIYDTMVNHGYYFVLADFADYLACQERVSEAYRDQQRWTRMSILNVARSGKFSSDRTIAEYARDIWHVPVGGGERKVEEMVTG